MLCTQYRHIQCYIERVKRLCYAHSIGTIGAVSRWSKDCGLLKQWIYTFLLITFLIFNQFQSKKVLES